MCFDGLPMQVGNPWEMKYSSGVWVKSKQGELPGYATAHSTCATMHHSPHWRLLATLQVPLVGLASGGSQAGRLHLCTRQ